MTIHMAVWTSKTQLITRFNITEVTKEQGISEAG
jgi:hypothetical protein